MHNVPTRLFPAIGDGHDSDTLVTKAWMALICFGTDLDAVTAARLLPMWRHYRQLTPEQVAAVIGRFPRPTVPTLPPGVLGQPLAGRTRARSIGDRT